MTGTSVRLRILVVGLLSAAALILVLLERSVAVNGPTEHSVPLSASLDPIIDSLLNRYGVAGKDIRTTVVRGSDGSTIRIERMGSVSEQFPSLEFNRDLAKAIRPLGGTVVGTERSREKTVVLHVVAAGMTVQSIYLRTDNSGQAQ